MPNYASTSDLIEVLSNEEQEELVDDEGDGINADDPDILSGALSRAESIVNSYLSKVYDVPLSTVPPSIKDATLTLAKHKLLMRKGHVNEAEQSEHDNVRRWLERVSEGKIELPEQEGGEESGGNVSSGFGNDDNMAFRDFIW